MSAKGKWIWGGLAVFGLTIGLSAYAASSRYSVFSAHREYDKAAQEYREAGLPWTIEEFTGPLIPDVENAAFGYDALYEVQKKRKKADFDAGRPPAERPRFNRLLTRADIPSIQAYLRRVNPELDQLPRLAPLSFQLKKDWSLGVAVLFPECAVGKGYVGDLLLRAEVKTLLGDIEGAVEDLNLCVRLADHMEQGPTLIHLLASSAYRSMAVTSCLKIATCRPKDPALQVQLAAVCAACTSLPSLRRALRGEAFMMLQSIRYNSFTPTDLRVLGQGGVRRNPSRKAGPEVRGLFNRSYAVEFFRFWAHLYAELGPEGGEDWKRFRRACPPSNELPDFAMSDPRADERKLLPELLKADFLVKLSPDLQRAPEAFVKRQAFALAAQSALQAHAAGILRTALPAPPQDPFGNGPLRRKVDREGIKVWSIGRDREDDGGAPEQIRKKLSDLKEGEPPRRGLPPKGDIAAELPWRPKVVEGTKEAMR